MKPETFSSFLLTAVFKPKLTPANPKLASLPKFQLFTVHPFSSIFVARNFPYAFKTMFFSSNESSVQSLPFCNL